MPETNDNKSNDVVPKEDYNKMVEANNTMKADMLAKEKQIKSFEKKEQVRKAKLEDKKKWQKEMEEKDKQIKELTEKKEIVPEPDKDDTVNRKGIVQEPVVTGNEPTAKEVMNERYQTDYKQGDPSLMSPLERLKFFKKPSTRMFNKEKFGELLSLQGSAQLSDPKSLPQKFHSARGNPPPEMDKIKT